MGDRGGDRSHVRTGGISIADGKHRLAAAAQLGHVCAPCKIV